MYFENKFGKVYYEVHGTECETTIVFCHGVSLSHDTFNPQINGLKDKYKVVVWDMPYHGLSSPIDDKLQFSKIAADFIIHILDEIKVDKAILVGQSLGSFVAQQAAFNYPERVRATVHLGGGSLYPKYNSVLKVLNPFIALSLQLYPNTLLYKSFAKHKGLTPETIAYIEESSKITGKKIISHLTQEMLQDMVKGIPEPSKEPLLLCYGDHDLTFIKNLSIKWHKSEVTSELAEIKKAHHIANQDNPKEFNKILISFLKGLNL